MVLNILDICLLGCGGMMPLEERYLTSLMVRYNGHCLLIDCGEGTQLAIRKCGWGFKAIDAILFTHFHADHIAGLPGLLLTIGNSDRIKPLFIYGPPGIRSIVQGLCMICGGLPYEVYVCELNIKDNNGQIFNIENIPDLEISALKVDHRICCYSYSINLKRAGKFDANRAKLKNIPIKYWSRLQKGEIIKDSGNIWQPEDVLGKPRKGIKVTYCTDTRPIPDIAQFAQSSDLFICEGMYGDDEKLQSAIEKKHMLFSEAAKLAKNAQVKELWLTHYSPSVDDPQEYIPKIKNIFPNIIAGDNGMKKEINFIDE